jgi:hypothetical protein
MKESFGVNREVTKIVTETVSLDKFKAILIKHKPKEIYCAKYSTKKPCWYITEYTDVNSVKFYADNWYDKTPMEMSFESLYTSWRIQGLNECYIL